MEKKYDNNLTQTKYQISENIGTNISTVENEVTQLKSDIKEKMENLS